MAATSVGCVAGPGLVIRRPCHRTARPASVQTTRACCGHRPQLAPHRGLEHPPHLVRSRPLTQRNDGLADGLTVSSTGHVATAFAWLRQRGTAPIRAEQQRGPRRRGVLSLSREAAASVARAVTTAGRPFSACTSHQRAPSFWRTGGVSRRAGRDSLLFAWGFRATTSRLAVSGTGHEPRQLRRRGRGRIAHAPVVRRRLHQPAALRTCGCCFVRVG